MLNSNKHRPSGVCAICQALVSVDSSDPAWARLIPDPQRQVPFKESRLVVQSLCNLGLVGRGPLSSELCWGEVTVGTVGPVGVVVATPVLDHDAGF